MSNSAQREIEVDVVVLGTGAAGLTAALSAAVNGAEVAVFEKSDKIGGTTAVSGGIAWIPSHDKAPDLTVADAMAYLRAQSFGAMDEELVETFVRSGQPMIDFIESHSDMRFRSPPASRITSRSCRAGGPAAVAVRWARCPTTSAASRAGVGGRITSFPADFSNVGLDAETGPGCTPTTVTTPATW